MELLTPPGLAGVAVVRAVGAEAVRLRECLRDLRGGRLLTGGAWGPPRPRRATLQLAGVAIDDVLVLDADDQLEVHLHGAPAVLDALRERFPLVGAAPADAAERLLREALDLGQLDLALEQRHLGFAAGLAALAALPEGSRRPAVAAALERSRVAMAQATPQRLVLVGAQNAGKSTFFNRLLGRERVLAGELPGLTRDPVEEVVVLGGYPYELTDTAGEGRAAAAIDAAAIAHGRALRDGAMVALLVDGQRGPGALERELWQPGWLVVATKGDLPAAAWPADVPLDLRVAAATASTPALQAQLGALLRAVRRLPPAGPVGGLAALDAAQLQALQALAR